MTDSPVNLNHIRKDRARAAARKVADVNAAKFGRTKAEKVLEAARQAKAVRNLDGQKRDPD